MPVMKVSWVTSPLALAFAQKFLPEHVWVPFFNVIGFFIGTYVNTHTKKKRLEALRKVSSISPRLFAHQWLLIISPALRPTPRPRLREARLPLNGPSPQLANKKDGSETSGDSLLLICISFLCPPPLSLLFSGGDLNLCTHPSCFQACRRYLPPDVITQFYDEWFYMFHFHGWTVCRLSTEKLQASSILYMPVISIYKPR